MSFLDINDLITKMNNPDQQIVTIKPAGYSSVTQRMMSTWMGWGIPKKGWPPTSSTACTSSTEGAIPFCNAGTGKLFIARYIGTYGSTNTNQNDCVAILYDRLNHSGGLNGTSTSIQTTNLPTAALTRYTDGVGVMGGIEIYSWVGATATTLTTKYTNQDGVTGRVSPPLNFGNTTNGNSNDQRFFTIPLQPGDTGIRSIESVTLAASAGAVGNFGVTLYKPLYYLNAKRVSVDQDSFFTGMIFEEIKDNACLSLIVSLGPSPSDVSNYTISLVET